VPQVSNFLSLFAFFQDFSKVFPGEFFEYFGFFLIIFENIAIFCEF
jgi:hypothetical protein